MSSLPDLIFFTARASTSGDTAVSEVVKKCGGNVSLARRRAWVASGFMARVTDSTISSSFVIYDIMFYARPLVGTVGRGGVGFLV